MSRVAQPGETVLLIGPDRKRQLARLEAGGTQHTHLGAIRHDDILGRPWGSMVLSGLGRRFIALRPSMEELLSSLPREGQIIFAKDIGYILLKLSVVPGSRVIEAGTGSGALAIALARYVTPGGALYTYENRADMYARSGRNLDAAGLSEGVTRHLRDVSEGFVETEVDALFLDLREPWLHLGHAAAALADGGFFGALVPTLNQLLPLSAALEAGPFEDVEIAEVILRLFKPVPERIRPQDRLTAHTGYLVFGRKMARLAREGNAPEPAPPADEDMMAAAAGRAEPTA